MTATALTGIETGTRGGAHTTTMTDTLTVTPSTGTSQTTVVVAATGQEKGHMTATTRVEGVRVAGPPPPPPIGKAGVPAPSDLSRDSLRRPQVVGAAAVRTALHHPDRALQDDRRRGEGRRQDPPPIHLYLPLLKPILALSAATAYAVRLRGRLKTVQHIFSVIGLIRKNRR